MLQIRYIHFRHPHFQQTVQYLEIPVQRIQDFQLGPAAVLVLPVVVSVLAGQAAEFPVSPPVADFISAFQTSGMVFFIIVVHVVIIFPCQI